MFVSLLTGPQRTLHVLHNSEQPASVFSILESGNKTIPLVADGLFDLLMNKMTSIYTSKKQTKIESKGPRFEIGDFCVKLGSVTMSQNFKGVLVEVSERTCSTRTVGNCGLPWDVESLCQASRYCSPANVICVITMLQTERSAWSVQYDACTILISTNCACLICDRSLEGIARSNPVGGGVLHRCLL